MGFDKLFTKLAGKPVLAYSLRAFADCKDIDDIVIVGREDNLAEIEKLVASVRSKKIRKVIPGGSERHLSVWAGLQSIDSQGSSFVAIHDGARPLTTPALISSCLALAREAGAACVASPVPDTVKRASAEQVVTEHVERTGLWAMQTPQIFASGLILQAYASLIAKHEMVTDEVSAGALAHRPPEKRRVEFQDHPPADLELAEHVLALRAKKAAEGATA